MQRHASTSEPADRGRPETQAEVERARDPAEAAGEWAPEVQPAADTASAPSAPAPPADSPVRLLRVLLAEDAPANRILSMHVLQRRGHTVTAASDGEKAFQLALAQDFDVVLMDVQMPVLDGYQATEAIRADRKSVV